MSYARVIPRDFFNEAKLLKCLGQLALKILDRQLPEGIDIQITETGEPFRIELDDSGYLYVANYPCTINGSNVWFATTYNNKRAYPLLCMTDGEETIVFDDNGNFDQDFINTFKAKQLFKVVRVYRKSARRMVLERNLTEAEAQRVVKRYPDSSRSMVIYTAQN